MKLFILLICAAAVLGGCSPKPPVCRGETRPFDSNQICRAPG